MAIFLVVKGSGYDARMQAKHRGIDLIISDVNIYETEVYCYVTLSDLPKVVAWYAEDTTKPCEAGSCLWYANRREA